MSSSHSRFISSYSFYISSLIQIWQNILLVPLVPIIVGHCLIISALYQEVLGTLHEREFKILLKVSTNQMHINVFIWLQFMVWCHIKYDQKSRWGTKGCKIRLFNFLCGRYIYLVREILSLQIQVRSLNNVFLKVQDK